VTLRSSQAVLHLRAPFVVLDPDHVVPDGAVAFRDGCVIAAGPARAVARSAGAPARDAGDVVLVPGLVNAHAHLELSALRGRLRPTRDLAGWIRAQIEILRGWSRADFIRSYRRGVRLALETGTTAVGDVCRRRFLAREAMDNPFRTIHHVEVIEPDGSEAAVKAAVVELTRAIAEAIAAAERRGRPTRMRLGLSPHAPYTVSGSLYRILSQLTRPGPVQTHLAESREEVRLFRNGGGPLAGLLEWTGRPLPFAEPPGVSPVAWLDRLGILRPPLVAVHANLLGRADVKRLARRRVPVVFCPRSHAFFRHPPHPVRALLRAGVAVALGTDSLASNDALDVRAEMREAVERHGVEPRESWRMATVHGSRALGLEHGAGALRPGTPADLVALVRPAGGCARDLLERLLSPGVRVERVWIDGEGQDIRLPAEADGEGGPPRA
jgi:cytosine/adenosine deaminase-related metal-dependent hydrolase